MAELLTNLLFEPKGKHDSKVAYNIKDTVMSADGSQVYFALKAVPVGIQLNNTEYWKLQIDLTSAKEAMNAAVESVNAAAELANAAAEAANAAATISMAVDVDGNAALNGKSFTVDADGNVTF